MILDKQNRKLLNIIQSEFPIEPRPFHTMAERVGETEQQVLERVRKIHHQGYVRELGAVFDLHRLGYVSTLCAAHVTSEAVESVTALINSFSEVTHNYLRDHTFNIWFTVIARSIADIDTILSRIRAHAGVVQVLSLAQRRKFKINVHFPIGPAPNPVNSPPPSPPSDTSSSIPNPSSFQDWEIRLLRVLSDPLPLTEHPFATVAQHAEVLEELVLERVRTWLADGVIRRFGARVAHQAAGYAANGMSVWKTSPDEAETAGRYMAAQPEVSHCYLRDIQPNWDYNLYAMIHGTTQDQVEAVTQRIADHTGLRDYDLLFSVKELKKTAPRYFHEGEEV